MGQPHLDGGEQGLRVAAAVQQGRREAVGGETPPAGDILAVMVGNLDAKDALLAIAPRGFFTIPHFNGYPAVLIALRATSASDVRAGANPDRGCFRAAPQPGLLEEGEPRPGCFERDVGPGQARATQFEVDGRRGAAVLVCLSGLRLWCQIGPEPQDLEVPASNQRQFSSAAL